MSDPNLLTIRKKLKEKEQDDSDTISSSSHYSSSSSTSFMPLTSQSDMISIDGNSNRESSHSSCGEKNYRFSYQAMNSLGNKLLIKTWREAISTSQPNMKQDHIYNVFCTKLRLVTDRFPSLKSFKSHESSMKSIAKKVAKMLLQVSPEDKQTQLEKKLNGKLSFLLHQSNKKYLDNFLEVGKYLREQKELKIKTKSNSVIEKRLRDSDAAIITARGSQFKIPIQHDCIDIFEETPGRVHGFEMSHPPASRKVEFIRSASSSSSVSLSRVEQMFHELKKEIADIKFDIQSLYKQLVMQHRPNCQLTEQLSWRNKRFRSNDSWDVDE